MRAQGKHLGRMEMMLVDACGVGRVLRSRALKSSARGAWGKCSNGPSLTEYRVEHVRCVHFFEENRTPNCGFSWGGGGALPHCSLLSTRLKSQAHHRGQTANSHPIVTQTLPQTRSQRSSATAPAPGGARPVSRSRAPRGRSPRDARGRRPGGRQTRPQAPRPRVPWATRDSTGPL